MILSRRSVLIGTVAVTLTGSGLLIQPELALALNFGSIGAGVIRGLRKAGAGIQHLQTVAQKLVHEAAQAASQVVNTVNATAEQLQKLEADDVPAAADHSAAELLIMAGPSCSNSHIPGFINHKKLNSAGDVFVVAVNDPFV